MLELNPNLNWDTRFERPTVEAVCIARGVGRERENEGETNMKKVGRKRQVHASSMRPRSFFDADDDEAMRTGRIMERMMCIQAARWRDAACCQ